MSENKILKFYRKKYKLIMLIVFCLILIISNSHLMDSQYRKNQMLEKKMKELKYEYIIKKSTWMKKIRREELRRRLNNEHFQEITKPPIVVH